MTYSYLTVTDAEGTSRKVAADLISTKYYPQMSITWGSEGVSNSVTTAQPLPVQVLSNTAPTSVFTNQKTISASGTRVALSTTPQTLQYGVTVKADLTNDDLNVYVGGASVSTTNGFLLTAGQQVFIPVNNLNSVYIDGDTGTSVTYIGS